MTTALVFQCPCGPGYKLFVPKGKLFGEFLGEGKPTEWEDADRQEEADGEIELARIMAEVMALEFIDSPTTERFACQRGDQHSVSDLVRGLKSCQL